MSNVKSSSKGNVAQAEVVSGPIDFDKLGGEELHFDRPIASSKRLKEKFFVYGYLDRKVQLQLPKESKDREPSDDPNDNTWGAYVFVLHHEALTYEGNEVKMTPAGREIYVPETAKLKELDRFLGQKDMSLLAIKSDGTLLITGGWEISKYRIKHLGTRERTGQYLSGGPQVAQLQVPAAGSPFAANVPVGAMNAGHAATAATQPLS